MNKNEKYINDYLFFQEGPGVRNYQYTTSGVKLLNVSNLVDGNLDLSNSNRYISNEEAKGKYKHFLCDVGDLIIASSGIKADYFDKKMGFVKEEMLPLCMNTSTIRFKPLNESDLNIKYFMYYLKSSHFRKQLEYNLTDSAQLNFGPSHLKKMKFIYHDISKQKEIVEKLDSISNMINLKKEQLLKFDVLIKSQFVEMFGDLNKYPLMTYKDCTNFVDYRGHTPKLSSLGNIRMINAKSVGKGFFKYIDEYVTEETYQSWMHRGFGYPGDVLFVTEGHTFGNTCLIPDDLTKFALGQRVLTIKCKEMINNVYLNHYMQTNIFIDRINVYKTGGTAQGIRSKDLLKVEIPVPSLDEQNRFAKIVKQIDKQKFEFEKSLKKLEELQASLMQEYFG